MELIDVDVSGPQVQTVEETPPAPPGEPISGDLPDTVEKRIRSEATRPNQSETGRPLPLASAWKGYQMPLTEQLEWIDKGHHFVPMVPWPKWQTENPKDGFSELADRGLPFAIILGTQWTDQLRNRGFENLLTKINGNDRLDVSAPKSEWRRLGEWWGSLTVMEKMQEQYPNPPLVLLVENNERHNVPQGENFRPQLAAIMEGIKAGLSEPSWKENSKFVGYQAGWPPWDGGMAPDYQFDWRGLRHYKKESTQAKFGNRVAEKRRLLEKHPEQWLELIHWDGGPGKADQYEKNGFDFINATQYEGWIQFGTWAYVPRVTRHYVTFRRDRNGKHPYTDKMLAHARIADRVFADETLRRFWRQSTLVPNADRANPKLPQWLPEKLRDAHRQFTLPVSTDPEGPFAEWPGDAVVPVWALARLARQRNGEYLVYAHATLEDQSGVTIQIPGGPSITVDVRQRGSFFHVSNGNVREVGI